MPLLEHRRRPPRDAAPRRLRVLLIRLDDLACRWWPPAWAAVFLLASAGGALLPGPPCPGHGPLGRAAALLPLLLRTRRPLARGLVWCAVAVAAAAWGQGESAQRRARPAAAAPAPLAPAAARSWRGALALRLTGHATAAADGRWRSPAVVAAVGPGDGERPPVRGDGAWLLAAGPTGRPGAVVRLVGTAAPPAAASVPGAFDLASFLAGRGLTWTVRAEGVPVRDGRGVVAACGDLAGAARDAVGRRLDALLPPREARLARAVLLGWRTPATRAEAAAFTTLGLAHLFAVSGLHVGILSGLVLLPAAGLGCGRGLRAALLAGAVAAFVALTGAPGSVVRAGAVVVLAAAVPALGRRAVGLRLLGFVFWAVAAWEPRCTLDVGVRLSYLAAAGIVAAHGLSGGFGAGRAAVLRFAAAGLGVSLAAQWATLPVVAASFGRVSPWSPLANLVAVPVFGLGTWLLAAATATATLWPGGGEALAAWAWVLIRALELAAAAAAGNAAACDLGLPPPGPAAVAAWLALSGAAAWFLRPRGPAMRRLAALVACLAAGVWVLGPAGRVLPPRSGPLTVQFAVDQGDCALVTFPDRWCALIDAGDAWQGGDGPFARNVGPWLRRQGVRRLDLVVLTHGHRDHTGGAAAVAQSFTVGAWLGGGRAAETVATGSAPWLRPGPAVRRLHRWRDWTLEAIDPAAAAVADLAENDRSLVLVLRRGAEAAMVWTGDLEGEGEAALLAADLVPAGARVWKAGHHGSATSGSGRFLAALRPGLVLVSCGVGNRHGHPSHGPYVAGADTLPVLRTDLQGTVRVAWNGSGASVRALRGGSP